MNSFETEYSSVGKNTLPLLLSYAFFILYGSLLPFEFNQLSFDTALSKFKFIPWLNLGPQSRADWIANILLYIPFSFLFCAQIQTRNDQTLIRLIKTAIVFIVSLVLAISIEFFQQFFPPRTVSLNDLLAESIGTVTGIVIWSAYGWRIVNALHSILQGRNSLDNFLAIYLLAYLLHALFPFDFITSLVELNNISLNKIAWTRLDSKGGFFYFGWSSIQIVLSVPVGFFLFRWFKKHYLSSRWIMLLAFGVGLLIESMQIFLVSGYFSGVAVVTRFIGIVIGFRLFEQKIDLSSLLLDVRRYVWMLALPYITVLAYFNGWRMGAGINTTELLSDNISHIKWLPFYYHYYQPETAALTSLLYIAMMYLPVGFGMYLSKQHVFRNIKIAAILALCLALIIEGGKLFFSTKHPDPTNAIIAAASGWLGFYWAKYFLADALGETLSNCSYSLGQEQWFGDRSHTLRAVEPKTVRSRESVGWGYRAPALLLIGFSIWQILQYPVFSKGLLFLVLAYLLLLWKFPSFWLVAIPALAPILDFTVSSGRLFFNEYDYLILITAAVGLFSGRVAYIPYMASPFRTLFLFDIVFIAY